MLKRGIPSIEKRYAIIISSFITQPFLLPTLNFECNFKILIKVSFLSMLYTHFYLIVTQRSFIVQELLEIPEPTQYPQIAESMLMKEPFDKLWNTAVRFQERYDTWTKGPILGLNAEEVAEEVKFKKKL